MKNKSGLAMAVILVALTVLTLHTSAQNTRKIVIYQAFTRLWGNANATNTPWGTMAENGVGKFADFTNRALDSLKALGITHIWYTGVPHHAVINDYTAIGVTNDDPDVVKGRAGSPYAVKDYYNVDPDLAVDPANRLDEFKALVKRTHQHGLKVLIDIVPNHVARHYQSVKTPPGVRDFGADDNKSVTYHRDNDFYYITGSSFKVPVATANYRPLGGAPHPLSDGKFEEVPAKWTGNGSRLAQPDAGDWYETVKINYGIRPDGSKDFDTLPASYAKSSIASHQKFWQGKSLPSSWKKFRDIALFWTALGVDGFRFDMAEMVPVEFWSYMNSAIKTRNPGATLVAEVYNPAQYRNYIHFGKMDYLYDKVGLYDSLRHIIQGRGSADDLVKVQAAVADIEHNMLHFLENHDEQRIASPAFAGNPFKALPAMVLSATISSSPTLIYFAQELGEAGALASGFGQPTRSTIFDYAGVPSQQRWMNGGKFDGALLSADEKKLRGYYSRLLNFTGRSTALMGKYVELQTFNRANFPDYTDQVFAFARWSSTQKLIIAVNFSDSKACNSGILVNPELIKSWGLLDGSYNLNDELSQRTGLTMVVKNGIGRIAGTIAPLESLVLRVAL